MTDAIALMLIAEPVDREPNTAYTRLTLCRHDLARHIEQLPAQIDAPAYELYGLKEEEITMIESA